MTELSNEEAKARRDESERRRKAKAKAWWKKHSSIVKQEFESNNWNLIHDADFYKVYAFGKKIAIVQDGMLTVLGDEGLFTSDCRVLYLLNDEFGEHPFSINGDQITGEDYGYLD